MRFDKEEEKLVVLDAEFTKCFGRGAVDNAFPQGTRKRSNAFSYSYRDDSIVLDEDIFLFYTKWILSTGLIALAVIFLKSHSLLNRKNS